MKRILTLLFAACTLTVAADDYNYLEVEQTSGTTLDVALASLRKITFSGTDMVIENIDETTRTVPLAALKRIYFSASPTPVEAVRDDRADRVTAVYSVDGRRLAATSASALQGGMYIIRRADGSTAKIACQR